MLVGIRSMLKVEMLQCIWSLPLVTSEVLDVVAEVVAAVALIENELTAGEVIVVELDVVVIEGERQMQLTYRQYIRQRSCKLFLTNESYLNKSTK